MLEFVVCGRKEKSDGICILQCNRKTCGRISRGDIKSKKGEIYANSCGISLWSVSIDKKSIEQVWGLNPTDEVVVLCKVSENAKDPVGKDNGDIATIMIGPDGEESIPKGIKTTFPKGKNYQSYVVKEYERLESPIIFDFGKYETILRNNKTKSFKERFKLGQFQNTFGRKNKNLTESCVKEIMVIMKLKYPFVVGIK